MLALWSSVCHVILTPQMLFHPPLSTALPFSAPFLNSFICLSKISGILKYLREGEKWKVGQGSVSVGHGIPLSMHRRCSHEVTGTQKWGKTSNTRCPQKLALVWQPWNLHGLLIQISNLFPFQSYLRLTSLKFFQYMIIFFLRARIRHIA